MKRQERLKAQKSTFKCPYTGKTFKSEGAWNSYQSSKKFQDLVNKNAGIKLDPTHTITETDNLDNLPEEKPRLWKKGDSPQLRWMWLLYCRAGEDEDNWESDEEMEEDGDETIDEMEVLEQDTNSEEEETMNPEDKYGPAPVELKPIPKLYDFFSYGDPKLQKYRNYDTMLSDLNRKYGFTIPDQKFLVDGNPEKILEHLAEKVGIGFTCIYCNKAFYSLAAVQDHMKNTPGHMRINIEGENALEYQEFYDYPEKETEDFEVDDMELVLPSGARIGHREMKRYYKQRFDFVPVGMETSVVAVQSRQRSGRQMFIDNYLNRFKALTWRQTQHVAKQEVRDLKRVQKIQKNHFMKLGISHNKVLQAHFKKQMMNCG